MPRAREDLYQAVCARPECGKVFFQRKVGQEFCSQDCANKAFPGVGGRKPTVGLGQRSCINPQCGKLFQPYRDKQFTCSRACYNALPSTRQRENDRRKTQEFKDRKNEWRRTDPQQRERIRDYNRQTQLARAGTTPEQYDARFEVQRGLCMICGSPAKSNGIKAESRLHQDHDHVTGQTRDLLCSNCNKGLGCFGDDPERLREAAAYIDRHRALAATLPGELVT
jgi:hypothetical protein